MVILDEINKYEKIDANYDEIKNQVTAIIDDELPTKKRKIVFSLKHALSYFLGSMIVLFALILVFSGSNERISNRVLELNNSIQEIENIDDENERILEIMRLEEIVKQLSDEEIVYAEVSKLQDISFSNTGLIKSNMAWSQVFASDNNHYTFNQLIDLDNTDAITFRNDLIGKQKSMSVNTFCSSLSQFFDLAYCEVEDYKSLYKDYRDELDDDKNNVWHFSFRDVSNYTIRESASINVYGSGYVIIKENNCDGEDNNPKSYISIVPMDFEKLDCLLEANGTYVGRLDLSEENTISMQVEGNNAIIFFGSNRASVSLDWYEKELSENNDNIEWLNAYELANPNLSYYGRLKSKDYIASVVMFKTAIDEKKGLVGLKKNDSSLEIYAIYENEEISLVDLNQYSDLLDYMDGYHSLISSYLFLSFNEHLLKYVLGKMNENVFNEVLTDPSKDEHQPFADRQIGLHLKNGDSILFSLTLNDKIYVSYITPKEEMGEVETLWTYRSENPADTTLFYIFCALGFPANHYWCEDELIDKPLAYNTLSLSNEKVIVQSYIDYYSPINMYFEIGQKFSGSVQHYYGYYDGYFAAIVDGCGIGYDEALWTDVIDGVEFNYMNGNEIKLISYGRCYTLKEGFEQGIINHEDLEKISKMHNK